MISVYTTAFNITKGKFNIESALKNFSLVGDEIVVGTIKNEDDTLDVLNSFKDSYPIKIVQTDYDTKTFAVDGKLKEAALQKCSGEFCIQLDADERVGNPDAWNDFISDEELLRKVLSDDVDALMLPVVNMYRDINSYKDINSKWYIHKKDSKSRGRLHRGVVYFARLEGEKFDKEKSDGCELLYSDSSLVSSVAFKNAESIEQLNSADIPFVVHLGYLDLSRRDSLNKEFWNATWASYGGTAVEDKVEGLPQVNSLRYASLDFSNLI